MAACNALSMLRMGAEHLARGKSAEAIRYFEGAEEWRVKFEAWRQNRVNITLSDEK